MTPATERQQFAMGRIVAAGYPAISAAAIVGNGCGESGPDLDSTFERVHADHGSGGFLEWRDSPGAPRKTRLAQFAQLHGTNVNDLGIQVDYAIWELGKYFPDLDAQLKNPGRRPLKNITANFCDIFENPASATAGVTNRITHAVAAMADWENAHAPQPAQPAHLPEAQVPIPAPVPSASPAAPPIQASWAARLAIELDQLMSLQAAYRAEFPTPFDGAIAALQKLGTAPTSVLQLSAADSAAITPQRTFSMPPNIWTSIFGTGGILAAGVAVFTSIKNGETPDATQVAVLLGMVSTGIGLIKAKDANVTGGTVPATQEAKARAASPPIK